MAPTIRQSPVSPPVPSLDVGRPRMAKADVAQPRGAAPVQPGPSAGRAWSAATKDALIRHFGSLKAAAIAMGNYDASQLTRDLDSGKFKSERLDLCDDTAKAFISNAVAETLAGRDPKARVQQLLRQARRVLDELAEALDAA